MHSFEYIYIASKQDIEVLFWKQYSLYTNFLVYSDGEWKSVDHEICVQSWFPCLKIMVTYPKSFPSGNKTAKAIIHESAIQMTEYPQVWAFNFVLSTYSYF